MKIWVQSMTDLTRLPGYARQMCEHAERVCSLGTSIELHGVRHGTYPPDTAPTVAARYRWIGELVSVQFVENAMRAERAGCDAFAMSCFGDPGLDTCRSVVDIPVLGSLQTSLIVASLAGTSFGLMTVDAAGARRARERVLRYGYADRLVDVGHFPPGFDEHVLDRAFEQDSDFLTHFERVAAELVAKGAEVIIPAEGVLNSLLLSKGVKTFQGAPVLDSFAALMKVTEMMVQLHAIGLATARVNSYAKPSPVLCAQLGASTAAALIDAPDREKPAYGLNSMRGSTEADLVPMDRR